MKISRFRAIILAALVVLGTIAILLRPGPQPVLPPSWAALNWDSASPALFKLKPDLQASLQNLARNDTNYFHSWPVESHLNLTTSASATLAALLRDPANYSVSAEKCFEPEWALHSDATLDILISLHCRRIQFIQTQPSHTAQMAVLSTEGAQALQQLLNSIPAAASTDPQQK